MNSDTPKVSVVIPTYNAPGMLKQTLDSVFAQTFADYEIIVVNDGSTDDTADQLKPLSERGKIRLINQANAGIGNARNRGIDESCGKYIALLDHDDLWLPGKLAAQVDFMQSHPDASGCSVQWSLTPTPEKPVCNFDSLIDQRGIISHPLTALAQGQVFLISSSILFDREKATGLRYMPYRKCIEDTPFQVKLFARGPFGIAGDCILMKYRVHQTNYSSQSDFFYNGIAMLRRLDRESYFQEIQDPMRREMLDFFAHLGRSATAATLKAGERRRAVSVYFHEFFHQLRQRRWKYLLATPALFAAPSSILKKAFSQ